MVCPVCKDIIKCKCNVFDSLIHNKEQANVILSMKETFVNSVFRSDKIVFKKRIKDFIVTFNHC